MHFLHCCKMIVLKCKYDHAFSLLLILHWPLHVAEIKFRGPNLSMATFSPHVHSILEQKRTTSTMLWGVFPTCCSFFWKALSFSGVWLPPSESSRLSTSLISETVAWRLQVLLGCPPSRLCNTKCMFHKSVFHTLV